MIEKAFISANQLTRESFELARQIYDSDYRPDVLLVLWRGGTPVGIAVHEFFEFKGLKTYHTAVKAASYVGIGKRIEPRIEHMNSVLESIYPESRVLIVDDIFESGCTVREVMRVLAERTTNVRVATLYYKPGHNETDIEPDFYLRSTDKWIVFPHELLDLSAEEIRAKDTFIADLVEEKGED